MGTLEGILTTDASETQAVGGALAPEGEVDSNKEIDADVLEPVVKDLKVAVPALPVPESAKAQIVGGSLLMGGLILLGKAMLVLAL